LPQVCHTLLCAGLSRKSASRHALFGNVSDKTRQAGLAAALPRVIEMGKRLKLYLLRVGADSTVGGGDFFSRIHDNLGTYTFIPIPISGKEKRIEGKSISYKDYKWIHQNVDISLFPCPEQFIHNDPEFETFTYGSPHYTYDKQGNKITEKNYKKLSEKIKKDDVLAFYAAFSKDGIQVDGLYLFAYFIVKCVVCWTTIAKLNEAEKEIVKNNHHFIHEMPDQVVIVGKPGESRLLGKAVLISSRKDCRNGNYYPCKDKPKVLGDYSKALNRSSLRTINEPVEITQLKQL
jgi:hypothetical protein